MVAIAEPTRARIGPAPPPREEECPQCGFPFRRRGCGRDECPNCRFHPT